MRTETAEWTDGEDKEIQSTGQLDLELSSPYRTLWKTPRRRKTASTLPFDLRNNGKDGAE